MSSWRLHFGWAIVTVLAVVVSARVASRQEPAPVREPAPAKSAPVAETAQPLPAPAAREVAAATASVPAEPVLDEERLIAQLRTADDFAQLKKLFAGIPDRVLKLKLLREALGSQDPRAVYAALATLKEMKGRDVADLLEAFLRVQAVPAYTAYAVELLGDVGDALSYLPLMEAFRSTDEGVRVNSADALKKLGYPAPAQELAIAYARQFESPDGALRKNAVETLAQLHLEGSIAVFARALKDSNGDVRMQALYAFSALDQKQYLPLLEPLLNDPNPVVAREAKDVVEGLKVNDP